MMKSEIKPGQRTTATILEFPEQFKRGAVLRKYITAMQAIAVNAPHPVIEIVLSLLEQVHRTNAAIAAYQPDSRRTIKNDCQPPPVSTSHHKADSDVLIS